MSRRSHRNSAMFVPPLFATVVVWVCLQAVLVISTLPEANYPVLSLLSTLGAAAAFTVLLRVGLGRGKPLPRPVAVAVAAGMPLTTLVNAYAMAPGTDFYPTPMAPVLLSPVMAVLALQGRTRTAAVSVVAVLACLVWLRAVATSGPVWAPEGLYFCGPVVMWWVWGAVTESLRRTSQLDLMRSDSAYALAREERRRTRERAEARERRRLLLEVAAVPLLRTVATSDAPQDDEVRTMLKAVEKDLRAELRGRDLLDPAVRRAASTARGRGVGVDVVDHAPPGADQEVLQPLRSLVAAALLACSDGELTARRPPHDMVLTLVHVGSRSSMEAVERAVRDVTPRLTGTGEVTVEVTADEDALVVDVSRSPRSAAG
ncbi:hypothetical protein [Quadrisphaera granulorum]|uniref:hypothetical protein n=1 Tax=Quadrisphaera granulorum TaxID=317664 RepID=UPI0011B51F88|nr:hypothetical protein [Quadrisphaera granulorum]